MVDILHRVGIKASLEEVYRALATRDGLAGSWTIYTRGDSKPGGAINFRFSVDGREIGGLRREGAGAAASRARAVADRRRTRRVDRYRGSFELKQEGDYSIVLFKHADWKEPAEFMNHCSTKWAVFLMSLKALVETGKGTPNPADPRSATGIETSLPDRRRPIPSGQRLIRSSGGGGGRQSGQR